MEDLNWAFAIEFDAVIVSDGISCFPDIDNIEVIIHTARKDTKLRRVFISPKPDNWKVCVLRNR